MWRACTAAAAAALVAMLAVTAPWASGRSNQALRLAVGSDELGWISLTVRGDGRRSVDVRELTGDHHAPIARLSLRDGSAKLRRAGRWRCDRRTRRFVVTTRGPRMRIATATIRTPSCADRLRMIVVPAQLRPGEAASVRVVDTWRLGAIAATVCTGPREIAQRCRVARIPLGARSRRLRLMLERPGLRTVSLRSRFGQQLSSPVDVRDDARLRVLVTGDSMVLGVVEVLAGEIGPRVMVQDDPRPGKGISTPGSFDWPAHARRWARTARADVTVVFLGSADGGYPLLTSAGSPTACCEAAWVSTYAGMVGEMMAAYLRHGLVYWVLLPAPRSPARAIVVRAENDAVRLAGSGFDGGVRVLQNAADVLSPGGVYEDSIDLDGRRQAVRTPDGVHLTTAGIRVVTSLIRDTLRRDDLLP